jgi:large subunit ribosomal protein L22
LVRGKPVRDAVNQLHFSTKRASEPVEKTVRSALANLMLADEASKLDPAEVYIREIFVDEGPTIKRWRPRAMGRATRINKRTSHLTVIVTADDAALRSGKKNK